METVFIELPRGFNSGRGQRGIVIRLRKRLHGQAGATCLWYEKLQNGLLDHGFVVSKVNPFLIISKTVIYVVCVYDCLFWACSKYYIDNFMESLKEYGSSYNW